MKAELLNMVLLEKRNVEIRESKIMAEEEGYKATTLSENVCK